MGEANSNIYNGYLNNNSKECLSLFAYIPAGLKRVVITILVNVGWRQFVGFCSFA